MCLLLIWSPNMVEWCSVGESKTTLRNLFKTTGLLFLAANFRNLEVKFSQNSQLIISGAIALLSIGIKTFVFIMFSICLFFLEIKFNFSLSIINSCVKRVSHVRWLWSLDGMAMTARTGLSNLQFYLHKLSEKYGQNVSKNKISHRDLMSLSRLVRTTKPAINSKASVLDSWNIYPITQK